MIRHAARIALIAFFAIPAIPAISAAQAPWRQIYKDSDVTVLFDTASVVTQPNGVYTTITSWDYARPRVLENKKQYNRLVERVYVRCSPVRVKRVRSTVYGANNTLVRDEGEVDARDQTHMVWDKPKTGTAGKKAFDSVCAIVTKKAPATATTSKKTTPR